MDHHVVHEPLLLLVVLTVERVNKILGCDHWNKTTPTVLSGGTIYLVRSSNFGQNPMLRRFQWNLYIMLLIFQCLTTRNDTFCCFKNLILLCTPFCFCICLSCMNPLKGAKPVPGPTMITGVTDLNGRRNWVLRTKIGTRGGSPSAKEENVEEKLRNLPNNYNHGQKSLR